MLALSEHLQTDADAHPCYSNPLEHVDFVGYTDIVPTHVIKQAPESEDTQLK
jgi:hypothetical protein